MQSSSARPIRLHGGRQVLVSLIAQQSVIFGVQNGFTAFLNRLIDGAHGPVAILSLVDQNVPPIVSLDFVAIVVAVVVVVVAIIVGDAMLKQKLSLLGPFQLGHGGDGSEGDSDVSDQRSNVRSATTFDVDDEFLNGFWWRPFTVFVVVFGVQSNEF